MMVLAVSAVVTVLAVTATPLKLTPPLFRHPDDDSLSWSYEFCCLLDGPCLTSANRIPCDS